MEVTKPVRKRTDSTTLSTFPELLGSTVLTRSPGSSLNFSGMSSAELPSPLKKREFFTPIPETKRSSTRDCKRAKARKRAAQRDKRAPKVPKFNKFAHLPAELRAKVWAIALYNQIEHVEQSPPSLFHPHFNRIHIHQHKNKEGNKKISIRSTRGHPSLFFVNREARYEAAKVDGGAWYPLGVGTTEVYANFKKEHVFVGICLERVIRKGFLLHKEVMLAGCPDHRPSMLT